MLSNEEWLHSEQTVSLVRWLEKKREEWTVLSLEESALGNAAPAARWAGQYKAAKDILAKIREKKDESL